MHRRVPHNIGFWLVAAAFASLQAFGTVPTPLWPLYAARDGLGSTTVTLAFACMVVGAASACTSSVISPTGGAGGGSSFPHSRSASRPPRSWRGGRPRATDRARPDRASPSG